MSLSEPLSSLLSRALSAPLEGPGGYTFVDADAEAYMLAVRGAGVDDASLLAAGLPGFDVIEPAVDTFYVNAKADGEYASLRRCYLTIWPVAAANAIDMISLASGTYTAGVIHPGGYVKGNGSTDFFDMAVGATTLGLSSASAFFSTLIKTDATIAAVRWLMGGITGAEGFGLAHSGVMAPNARHTGTAITLNGTGSCEGILTMSSTSDASRSLRRRNTAGAVSLATSAGEAAFTMNNNNIYGLARNFGGVSLPTDAEFGAMIVGLGLSDAATDSFTLKLKTLWETSTGLTLS